MRQDIVAQIADYRGLLHWDSYMTFQDGVLISRPAVDIPLFIKDHPIPYRKPKLTEINTVSMVDPTSQTEVGTAGLFWGSPDLLSVTLQGWLITPTVNGVYNPTVDGNPSGASLGVGRLSYAEVISAYIEGRMHNNINGVEVRRNPEYYISPYGNQYTRPIIQVFEAQNTVNPRKQTFNMTLLLET